jgi:hypothetical protein
LSVRPTIQYLCRVLNLFGTLSASFS